jgi:hypothetical protein
MRSEAWRKLLRRFIRHDIPEDMAACFDCDETSCPEARFAACSVRLARVAVTEGSADG